MSNLEEVVKLHDRILVEETSKNDFLQQAYPSYFGMVKDGTFKGLIKERTDILSLEKVGGMRTGVKTVNVNDFGAKGDGNDDTEVTKFLSIKAGLEVSTSVFLDCPSKFFASLSYI